MSGLMPANILSYVGEVAVPFIVRTFPPTTAFNEFGVPTVWIDSSAKNAYVLVAKPLGVAAWVNIGGVPGEIDTITTPDSVVVVPSSNNINFANGTGSNITGSGSTVTFNMTGGGYSWNTISVVGPTTMVIHNGYNAAGSSQALLLLPVTAPQYSTLKIIGSNSGGWRVTQSAGQQIFMNVASTTIGVAGYMEATMPTDCVELICTTANTNWKVISSEGNPNLL